MNRFAGYCWCARCEHFAPWEHKPCDLTRRAAVVVAFRSGFARVAPLLGKTLSKLVDAGVDAATRTAAKDQGVWIGEYGRWFADVSGETGGPFDTCADALLAFVEGWSPKTKRQARIFEWAPEGVAKARAVPPSADIFSKGEAIRSDLGQLVGEALPAISIHRRDLQYFIVQDGVTVIRLAFEGMPALIRALEGSLGGDPAEFDVDQQPPGSTAAEVLFTAPSYAFVQNDPAPAAWRTPRSPSRTLTVEPFSIPEGEDAALDAPPADDPASV